VGHAAGRLWRGERRSLPGEEAYGTNMSLRLLSARLGRFHYE